MIYFRRSIPLLFNTIKLFRSTYPLINKINYRFADDNIKKLKEQSKEFYKNQVSNIIQLQNYDDWGKYVEESREPVVLDCYADWCQPCKILTPKLQQKAKNSKGWKLLKLNIDKLPQLANLLQIKAVPTVFLIAGGKGIDKFQGAPDQNVLNKFFSNLDRMVQGMNQQQQIMKKIQLGRTHLMNQNHEQGQKIFEQVLKKKLNPSYQTICRLLLSECYLKRNKLYLFEQTINKIDKKLMQEKTQDENLLMLQQFYSQLLNAYEQLKSIPKQDQKIKSLENLVKNDQNNLQNKFNLALAYNDKQLYEQAMKILLEIIKKNKNWQQKKANKLLLQIFKKVGLSSELTLKYRKIFQRLLY